MASRIFIVILLLGVFNRIGHTQSKSEIDSLNAQAMQLLTSKPSEAAILAESARAKSVAIHYLIRVPTFLILRKTLLNPFLQKMI
jgi:hypothetical protein